MVFKIKKKIKGDISYVLLNVHEKKIAKDLWKKLRDVYEAKSLVNKHFIRMKMYSLNIKYGGSIVDHLNAFNMIVS